MTTNYFNLPEEKSSAEKSKVVIVPVPYEATIDYGKGTKKGPEAIAEASHHIELFDDELWVEPYKVGIQTADAVQMNAATPEDKHPFEKLEEVLMPIIEFGKFPIILGGEHSISVGAVKACAKRYPDLSVLQLDAHADLRKTDDGNQHSHACAAHHMYKALPNPLLTQVGVRSISEEEANWLEKKKPNINTFWAHSSHQWNLNEIIASLSDNVYLNIDLSCLDSTLMPAVNAPEPGGMGWHQLLELIKILCVRKNVVAADIVELAPIKGFHAPDYLAAKLIYKMIGYRFALELGVTKRYLSGAVV